MSVRPIPATADPASAGEVQNVLSFDLEHWHSATLLTEAVSDPADRIVESVERVLALLEARGVNATFFVVGEVAREYPDLIARVAEAGHEVASHGHTHTPLSALDPASFRTELAVSAAAIRDAVGDDPVGFRAPNFSVTRETAWAFDVLRAAGLRYDASVFPVRTPMYGVTGSPIHPYAPAADDPFAAGHGDGLVEFPAAVFGPRLRLPVAGGFYARALPTAVLERGVRNLNRRGVPATLYFHPWEFNPEVATDEVPLARRYVSFYGVDRLAKKLDRLLATFEFGTVRATLDRL